MIFVSGMVQKVSNHPVHIVDSSGNLSPSAFIPFCGYGGNMSAMGEHIEQFDAPVCSSFKAKILNTQLCYEVDVNKIFSKVVLKKGLKIGLLFLLDYNEDRQIKDADEDRSSSNLNPLNELGNIDWKSMSMKVTHYSFIFKFDS